MLKIDKFEIMDIIANQYKTPNTSLSDVEVNILLIIENFRYDREEKKWILDHNKLHLNMLHIKRNYSEYKLTGYEVLRRLNSYFDKNECKNVMFDIWVDYEKACLTKDDSEFVNLIEIDAHIKFDDDIHPDDNFINQGMMDFAFIVKDRQLFDELAQKYNKKDKV